MRTPDEPTPTGGYPRPQQTWQCGLSNEAAPCALGPSAWGRCPAAAACHPTRDGDRWHCNRSPLRGGPCSVGPGPDGMCAIVHCCTPRRSLRSRRGRLVMGCLVAGIGAACMALSGSWRNHVVAPGALSVHHAHLIDGAEQAARCANCHPAANAPLAAWAGWGADDASPGAATQSAFCMECHAKTLSRELALGAHGLGVTILNQLDRSATGAGVGDGPARLSEARRDPHEAIACAACHREHQGRMHNLTAISDAACQACHREQYASIADGHPDFGLWPYERRTRIAFNHAAHQGKHHPAAKRAFACADCHEADATGAWQVTRSYAASCAACHDKALELSLADGVPLVALPTLDLAALREAESDVGAWPEEADGDFDGRLPFAAALLLAGKPQASAALVRLGPALDFYDVNPVDAKQLVAAGVVAAEFKALVDELATRGDAAIAERLSAVLGREVSASELNALAAQLSPELVARTRQRWFAGGESGVALAGGGWTIDDATLSLRYQPAGHADPWLRAWLDVLAAAATGLQAEVAEPLLRAALKPTAAGQCGTCHSIERSAAGRLAIQWTQRPPGDEFPALTHYSHASHVLQSQLSDCTACHAIAPHAAAAYATDDPRQFVADFAPLTKASCVTCHTPTAAGSSCTQCHRYHGGGGDREQIVILRSAEEFTRQ